MAFTRKPPPGNVRRVVCLGHNLRGVTTNKRGSLVQFESELEHLLILLLERDPSVVDYRSQPEMLRFRDVTGRRRTYTPDFQVWRTDGRIELHEVTVETRRQQSDALQQREAAATALCQERGWSYIVHTDRSLPTGAVATNLSFLSGYRAHSYADPMLVAVWLSHLRTEPQHPHLVLAQLTTDHPAHRAPAGALLAGLYHLLWHNRVQMDWDRPLIQDGALHPTACVWRTGQAVPR